MPIFAQSNPWRRSALALLIFTSLALIGLARFKPGIFDACEILRTRINSAAVERYSETTGGLDLFAPVATAVARSKITKLVEQRSQFDCAITLFRLWRISTGGIDVNGGGIRP
jgi:hypothetical protein